VDATHRGKLYNGEEVRRRASHTAWRPVDNAEPVEEGLLGQVTPADLPTKNEFGAWGRLDTSETARLWCKVSRGAMRHGVTLPRSSQIGWGS